MAGTSTTGGFQDVGGERLPKTQQCQPLRPGRRGPGEGSDEKIPCSPSQRVPRGPSLLVLSAPNVEFD